MNDEITVEEWRAEVDALRVNNYKGLSAQPYTDEQMKVLLYARSGSLKVTWKTLSKYWRKRGWTGYSVKKLFSEYKRAKEMGLVDVEKLR